MPSSTRAADEIVAMGTHCGILHHRTCLASAHYSTILVALYALDMLLTMFALTVFVPHAYSPFGDVLTSIDVMAVAGFAKVLEVVYVCVGHRLRVWK
jgi:hypothetical protein